MAMGGYDEGTSTPRQSVYEFALLMEKVLLRHDHKGHWKDLSNEEIFALMLEEVAELARAIYCNQKIALEATDVANFCMMLADNNKGKR